MTRKWLFIVLLFLGAFGATAQTTTRTVYIDPANADAPSGWNNVNFNISDATALLHDSLTQATNIRITVTTPLQGPATSAATNPTGAAAEFAPAGTNSVYGNTNTVNKIFLFGEFVFSNLSTNTAYHFTFYGSCAGDSNTREALYTLTGTNCGSNTLDASGNSSQVATVSNIFPRANGTITLRIERGPNNTEPTGFFYLTAMKMTFEAATAPPAPEIISIYVDTAGAITAPGWNLVCFNNISTTAYTLSETNRTATGISLQVTTRLNVTLSNSGSAALSGAAAEFAPASTNNAMGNTVTYSGELRPYGIAVLSGLTTNKAYTFTFFASRANTTENLEALYTLTGSNCGSNTLNAANNSTQVATVADIYPAPDGTITLRVEKGPANNNSLGFFYLAAFKITYASGETPAPVASAKRLLFFGSSFSQVDDVPGHVASLATLAGHPAPLVVTDLMGGQDLAYHITQIEGHPANNVTNVALTGTNTWDNVIIQGYSTEPTHLRDATAFRANALTLFQRVRNHASGKGAGARAVLYQTWARAPGHRLYPDSFANPAAMQLEIRTNYQAAADGIVAAEGAEVASIAPAGDAFERAGFAQCLYGADLHHAGSLGTRLAAMVLYKTIYSAAVTNIPYSAAVAAGWTSLSSNDWTHATYWADGLEPPGQPPAPPPSPTFGIRDTFLIDTAGTDALSVPGWNSIAFNGLNSADLVLTNGYETDVTCTLLARMNGADPNSSAAPNGEAALFAPAGCNSAFGNTGTAFNGTNAPVCLVRFGGLTTGRRYTFTFYASRMDAADNLDTLYTLTGANSGSNTLNAADNSSQVTTVADILPSQDGMIELRIEAGPNNTSPHKFFHINAIRIEAVRRGTLILIGS